MARPKTLQEHLRAQGGEKSIDLDHMIAQPDGGYVVDPAAEKSRFILRKATTQTLPAASPAISSEPAGYHAAIHGAWREEAGTLARDFAKAAGTAGLWILVHAAKVAWAASIHAREMAVDTKFYLKDKVGDFLSRRLNAHLRR